MASPKRRTLADRNNEAISREDNQPATKEAAPVAPTVPEPVELSTPEVQAEAPKEAKKVGRPARTVDVTRVGIYLTPEQFNNSKAAYLADWSNGREANTFTKWIGEALSTHAKRSPQERQKNAVERPARSDKRTGNSRSFNVPTEAVQQMRAAISQEHDKGRWLSDSAWCGEAIDAAISEAQKRNDGVLPVPPERLPNRLVR